MSTNDNSCSFFPGSRRCILYVFSFLCTSLTAGVVFGWPALRQQLQEDGSELSEKTLGAIFTAGSWSIFGGRFFTGLVRDRYGTRLMVCLCLIAVALGTLGVGLSDPNSSITLGVSLFFVGLGSGVQLGILPVAGLFPQNTGLITSSITGAFQISGLVFLALTSGSSSRKASFTYYSAFILLLTIFAMFLLPKGNSFVASNEELSDQQSEDNHNTDVPVNICSEKDLSLSSPNQNEVEELEEGKEGANDSANSNNSGISQTTNTMDNEDPTPNAIDQLKSLEYHFLVAWFSTCLVPLQYYIGSIGFQLEGKGDDDGFYTDLFSIVYAGVIIMAPVGGALCDRLGLGFTQGLATLLTATSLFILGSETISLKGQSGGLVVYGMGRMFVFGMYFTNIAKRFGYTNHGTLTGLGLLVSAVVSLLQYPLIALAVDGKATAVNIGCGASLLVLSPYFFWLHRRENPTRMEATDAHQNKS